MKRTKDQIMERTKKMEDPELITWKKTGGGSFRMRNRIIKPGQVFKARLDEIPEAFRDIVIPVDEKQFKAAKAKEEAGVDVNAVELAYFVQARGAGYYNVVDVDGKVQNEKALRKDAAEALIQTLKGE